MAGLFALYVCGGSVLAETNLALTAGAEIDGVFRCDSLDENAPVIELPELPEVMWFPMDGDAGWRADPAFASVVKIAQGYAPLTRDRLEMTVFCARIVPEQVATGFDYARVVANLLAATESEGDARGRDNGDILARWARDGFDKHERIGTWRRGTHLVIVQASYDTDYAATAAPIVATLFGSLNVPVVPVDPVEQSLTTQPLPTGAGPDLQVQLPGNWDQLMTDGGGGKEFAAQSYLDRNDPAGNAAISVFRIDLPKAGLVPDEDQMRQLAAQLVDTQISTLLTPDDYRLDQEIALGEPPGQQIGAATRTFVDTVTLADGVTQLGAKTVIMIGPQEVVAVGSITAYPGTDALRMVMMHTNYAVEVMKDSLRQQLAPVPQ